MLFVLYGTDVKVFVCASAVKETHLLAWRVALRVSRCGMPAKDRKTFKVRCGAADT
jgi:hypothetical protein